MSELAKLSEIKWKLFRIGDIFEVVKRGDRTYMPTGASCKGLMLGNTPRVSVTAQNNGISEFTEKLDNESYRTYENFVSVSFLGSAFYHPYKASLDMKVHCLQPKGIELSPAKGLFLAVMMKHSVVGVTYGNQLSSSDLVSRKILLPVNPKGNPDWEYMELFVKEKMRNML